MLRLLTDAKSLVHSDQAGPSRLLQKSGARWSKLASEEGLSASRVGQAVFGCPLLSADGITPVSCSKPNVPWITVVRWLNAEIKVRGYSFRRHFISLLIGRAALCPVIYSLSYLLDRHMSCMLWASRRISRLFKVDGSVSQALELDYEPPINVQVRDVPKMSLSVILQVLLFMFAVSWILVYILHRLA